MLLMIDYGCSTDVYINFIAKSLNHSSEESQSAVREYESIPAFVKEKSSSISKEESTHVYQTISKEDVATTLFISSVLHQGINLMIIFVTPSIIQLLCISFVVLGDTVVSVRTAFDKYSV